MEELTIKGERQMSATKTTALVSDTECFYCSQPIDEGTEVYDEDGTYAHVDCYETHSHELDEAAENAEEEMDQQEDEVEEEVEEEELIEDEGPDDDEPEEEDTEGPDGGDDE
jgi:hypothetical protein